jgi:hypothetical protein
MAFNSNTYRMNRYRKEAWAHLADARELKARVQCGECYSWEPPRVRFHVEQARICMRLHLRCRAYAAISRTAR